MRMGLAIRRGFALSMTESTQKLVQNSVEYKKLKYMCDKRGMKETEILLGGFFSSHGNVLSSQECKTFERFLQEPDPDIFNWLMKKSPLPVEYGNESVIEKLKNYWCSEIADPANHIQKRNLPR